MAGFQFNSIRASQISNVVLDCVVNPTLPNVGKTTTGAAPTDNTAAINDQIAAMVAFSVGGACKLILDGGTAVTGLILPSGGNFEIEGIGEKSGIYMLAGSNSHAIYNNGKTPPFDQGAPAPAQGGYIRLSNFCINGNRGNGSNGNSTTGDPRGPGPGNYFYSNIDLANLSAVRIENMFLYDSPAYEVRLNNCGDTLVLGNNLLNPNTTPTANQDGVHIDGSCTDVRILCNKIANNASDDAIAINAPEGYAGAIARVVIYGNTYINTSTGLRVYGAGTSQVFQVTYSGNRGTVGTGILFGAGSTQTQDLSCQTFQGSDNDLNCTTGPFINVTGSLGNIALDNCVSISPSTAASFVQLTSPNANISHLSINNCQIYRTTFGAGAANLLAASFTTTIGRLTINGFQIVNENGQAFAAIGALLTMANITIGTLTVDDVDMVNITSLADSYANITNFKGSMLGSQTSTKTGAYTVLPTDGVIFVDATAGAFNLTAPTKLYPGHTVQVVKIDSSANAVTRVGTFSGVANPTLAAQYAKARWTTNGTNLYDV